MCVMLFLHTSVLLRWIDRLWNSTREKISTSGRFLVIAALSCGAESEECNVEEWSDRSLKFLENFVTKKRHGDGVKALAFIYELIYKRREETTEKVSVSQGFIEFK